jgi:hypothetical protein
MSSDRQIKCIIYLTVTAWTVLLWFNHETIRASWFKPLSTATTIVLVSVMIFDLWAWKLQILHNWFVKRPVIDGTWSVEITSTWIDPSTGLCPVSVQ